MSWKKLLDYYGIPYRTLQDWYMDNRRILKYQLRLMIYKFKMKSTIEQAQEPDKVFEYLKDMPEGRGTNKEASG